MTMYVRRLIQIALGATGGLALWPVIELMIHLQGWFSGYLVYTAASGAVFGFVFGAFLGGAEGIIASRARRIISGSLSGALIGAVGGAAGFLVGQGVLFVVGDRLTETLQGITRIAVPVGRAVGWGILGACVGAAGGIRSRSGRKSLIGALGGFIGGILGGGVVEYGRIIFGAAPVALLVGLLLLGALIGIAFAWVEKQLSFGVFRVLNGPFKSREFILNQHRMVIGTRPRCDIPLPPSESQNGGKPTPGYRNVTRAHCRLLARGRHIFIQPLEGTVLLNDGVIDSHGEPRDIPLKFDDVVACGDAKFLYMRG